MVNCRILSLSIRHNNGHFRQTSTVVAVRGLVMSGGFYKLKCGCVKFSNSRSGEVKKGFELGGVYRVVNCSKHGKISLSGYEKSILREYELLAKDGDIEL